MGVLNILLLQLSVLIQPKTGHLKVPHPPLKPDRKHPADDKFKAFAEKAREIKRSIRNNQAIARRINNGTLTPEKVLDMKGDDWKSEEKKEEERRHQQEAMREAQAGNSGGTRTENYPCPNCGGTQDVWEMFRGFCGWHNSQGGESSKLKCNGCMHTWTNQ